MNEVEKGIADTLLVQYRSSFAKGVFIAVERDDARQREIVANGDDRFEIQLTSDTGTLFGLVERNA